MRLVLRLAALLVLVCLLLPSPRPALAATPTPSPTAAPTPALVLALRAPAQAARPSLDARPQGGGGAAWQHAPVPRESAPDGDFHELIDVGGYRLDLKCRGSGGPVVVMDNAFQFDMREWDRVAPEVAKLTRVCTYDRAGIGRSEAKPILRTSRDAVDELRTLLANAKVEPPYVLVGHDLGGMHVRLYASLYPDEVAGLVLVDATHEDQEARLAPILPAKYRDAVMLPRRNFERLAPDESYAQLRAAPPLPPVPLIVLTHGVYTSVNPSDLPPEVPEKLEQAWRELQADLARRAPGGRQVIAERSGHNIQRDQPELVVESIRQVVLRSGPGSPSGPLPRSGEPSLNLEALALVGLAAGAVGLALRRLGHDRSVGGLPSDPDSSRTKPPTAGERAPDRPADRRRQSG